MIQEGVGTSKTVELILFPTFSANLGLTEITLEGASAQKTHKSGFFILENSLTSRDEQWVCVVTALGMAPGSGTSWNKKQSWTVGGCRGPNHICKARSQDSEGLWPNTHWPGKESRQMQAGFILRAWIGLYSSHKVTGSAWEILGCLFYYHVSLEM